MCFSRVERGDKYNPEILFADPILKSSERFSHESLCPVALVRFSYSLTGNKPRKNSSFTCLQVIDNDLIPRLPSSLIVNTSKLAILLNHHLARLPHAVRRFLPFVLLLFRIKRPLFVLILLDRSANISLLLKIFIIFMVPSLVSAIYNSRKKKFATVLLFLFLPVAIVIGFLQVTTDLVTFRYALFVYVWGILITYIVPSTILRGELR